MKKITVSSNKKELTTILNFINKDLSSLKPSPKFSMQLELSIEEVFVNIINYAFPYKSNDDKITIKYSIEKNPSSQNNLNSKNITDLENNSSKVIITFIDEGIPYNPLKTKIPDISLSSDEREIGGLGILLVKKNVDHIHYEYKAKKNILTIEKKLDN